MKIFEKLKEITSPTVNFSMYRELLEQILDSCIPYMGIYYVRLIKKIIII